MMDCLAPPLERLRDLLDKVEVDERDFEAVRAYQDVFVRRNEEFGRYFVDYFMALDRTRMVLEYSSTPIRMQSIISRWFKQLFTQRMDKEFLKSLWLSGVKHVEINLGQRYVNLGYAVARQFCQKVVQEEVPLEDQVRVVRAVDKFLDFCVLAATDAYTNCTTRCDKDIIAGIAHQVRNPVMVIGGNIRRLRKKEPSPAQVKQAYDMVLKENSRLERMLADVRTFTDLMHTDPHLRSTSLTEPLHEALGQLRGERDLSSVNLTVDVDDGLTVWMDEVELQMMLYYLLENSLDAVDPGDPLVEVKSESLEDPRFIRLSIFNTGDPPEEEEIDQFFNPFHSSKPMGTGFGLPIASLIARRNLSILNLIPEQAKPGTRCIIDMPAYAPQEVDAPS
jgi:signal transduction histidine kinase